MYKRQVPRIGFGTAGLGDATEESAKLALAAGYRHIDTAQVREQAKYFRKPQSDPFATRLVPQEALTRSKIRVSYDIRHL